VAHLPTFLALAAVVIATPGPDTALTIRNTLVRGRGEGVLTALGVTSGQAVWTLAASAGVAAVVAASHPLFLSLRLAGAGYLVYLGVQTLRRRAHARVRGSGGAGYRQGLLSNLGNPKMAIFFTSLLPQFTGTQASFAQLLALGFLFCMLTLVWLSAYAVVVSRARRIVMRRRRVLDAITGTLLVAFGLRLAVERS
jgi:threonine/homoserine/homoserine lactone efflux protein